MFFEFLKWADANHLGDLSGLAGLLLTLVGFGATLFSVWKAEGAAKRAERAATDAKERIRELDSILDLSAVVAALEEIRRLHRQEAWTSLPDRYAHVRKLLIGLLQGSPTFAQDQRSTIEAAVVLFRTLEHEIDRLKEPPGPKKKTAMGLKVSEETDRIIFILENIRLKSQERK